MVFGFCAYIGFLKKAVFSWERCISIHGDQGTSIQESYVFIVHLRVQIVDRYALLVWIAVEQRPSLVAPNLLSKARTHTSLTQHPNLLRTLLIRVRRQLPTCLSLPNDLDLTELERMRL